MLDSYKRRIQSHGGTMANALHNQSNNILNHSFKNDISYKNVVINKENVDARYYTNKSNSISGDAVDYLLQFRPNITYPIGTYVSIANNSNVREDWLIVANSDDVMFPKANILKCNYNLKWISNKRIIEYKSVLRSKGSINGVSSNSFMSTIDGSLSIWLPFNNDTKLIDYKTRFLITYNDVNPQCYLVTNIEDVKDFGLTKLTVKRDEISPYDNLELMIADYFHQFPNANIQDDVYSYQLVGADSMTINSKSTYEVNTFLDGEIIETPDVTFSITDNLGKSTDLVTYSTLGNKITINSKGVKCSIVLQVLINDTTIDKTIKIKGLL